MEPLDFSSLPTPDPDLPPVDARFDAHTRAREQALIHIFGPTDTLLSPGAPDLLEAWPAGGILVFPPKEGARDWRYVTSGLALPDFPDDDLAAQGDPDAVSGLGLELVLSTPQEAPWAPAVLLDCVRFLVGPRARLIEPGARIPYRGLPGGTLTHLLAVTSVEVPHLLRLPAGLCTLVHLVGVTTAEVEKARALGPTDLGSLVLAHALVELGVGETTDPSRGCLTRRPGFQALWDRLVDLVGSEEDPSATSPAPGA